MSRLTRDGTTEPVSRDHILRRGRGQGKKQFACSADHEQDWQPYPVDLYSCYSMCDDHAYIHTVTTISYIPHKSENFFLNAAARGLYARQGYVDT